MVEYVLLVTAVLLVCVFFYSSSTGPMPSLINATLNSMINQVNNLNGQIQLP